MKAQKATKRSVKEKGKEWETDGENKRDEER